MSKNKYLDIYEDIFQGSGENNELKISKSNKNGDILQK